METSGTYAYRENRKKKSNHECRENIDETMACQDKTGVASSEDSVSLDMER